MAKIQRQVGTTSQICEIFIQNSGSTTGAGLTGLTNGSSGLTCYYKRNTGSASVAVSLDAVSTLGTYEPSNNAHGAFLVVDGTNMPGIYEFQLPNNALASGADSVVFYLQGVTNMAPCVLEIELTATSNQDSVHGGMSALPNAAANANGGLPILSSSGTTLAYTVSTVTTVTNQLTAAQIATGVWQDATAGDFTTASSIGKCLYISNIAPGAAGGHFIAGVNAATTVDVLTLTGTAASGATPATSGLVITGGAASTTSGGTAAAGLSITGGAGAASTNGAAAAVTWTAGGTTTVSGNDAFICTATGNGNGVTFSHAGTGKDINATTTNALQVDLHTIATQTVTCSAGVTIGVYVGNATHAIAVDSNGYVTFNNTSIATVTTVTNQLTAAQIATGVWQDTVSTDFATASSIGKSLYTSGNAPGAASGLLIAGSNAATTFATLTSTGAFSINGTSNVAQSGDSYAIVNSGTYGNSALHTQIGSPWQVGTKYAVTLASTDVTGNIACDLQTIKTQTVTCSAGVTVGAYVGNATHAIAVDSNGYVTFNNTTIATATSVTNAVSVLLTQTLNAARALDSIADTSLTLNDAFHCAIAVEAGKWAISGTTWTCQTPDTGTTLRTFTLDSSSAPTQRS